MKAIRFLISLIAISFISVHSVYAQYADLKDDASDITELSSRYRNLTDAGKAVTYTGIGMAVAGGLWVLSEYVFVPDDLPIDSFPVGIVAGSITAGLGAGVLMVGVPMWIAGARLSKRYGGNVIEFRGDDQRGAGIFANVGYVFPHTGEISAVGGYHFSEKFFLGGGVKFAADPYACYLPFYANARYSVCSQKVSPYFSVDAGYDVVNTKPYGSIEFGSRIRTGESERNGGSWWIGIAATYLHIDEVVLPSVRVGYSF